MLHRTSGDVEKFYNISRRKELGEKEKIVIVFPTALTYCWVENGIQKNTTKWSDGETFGKLCPNETAKDDVNFFKKMVDTFTKILPINKRMIFVIGFSSGGVMAAKLGVELSGTFSAVGCGAGLLIENDTVSVLIPKIPFWEIIGTNDEHFIESSFKRPAPFNDSILTWTQNNIRNYLGTLNLTEKYTKHSTAISITYDFKSPLPGARPGFFRYTLFNKLDHVYFNGKNYLPDNPLLLTEAELFWGFFKQAGSTTTPTQESHSNTIPIHVFPTPSKDYVFIDVQSFNASQPLHYQVMDMQGRIITSNTIYPNSILRIAKQDIGCGMYLVKFLQTDT